ncbi:hypothetical protein psal_cds_1206 [Pandoravirus salinus]|uniref:Ankyrin repeat domain containing protein n=1 Tax=Pandoravirus salinus TaxID=1349410 RepID=S4W149_9VIRU|nr:hypothetical protein psal_cds_1206 [Pandoravirus salinus]AGO85506.1 hypothetical protein psal_cds_1206 [Pandoravirus salinus]
MTAMTTTADMATTKAMTTPIPPRRNDKLSGPVVDDDLVDPSTASTFEGICRPALSTHQEAVRGQNGPTLCQGAHGKRPRQDGERDHRRDDDHNDDDNAKLCQEAPPAKRLRQINVYSDDDDGDDKSGSSDGGIGIGSMPAETVRAIVDLVGDRDLYACLLASSCFHVYSRAEMLARRYALGSGRDIFDSNEPVGDVIALCKRQRRRISLAVIERPAARGRHDIVAVVMQAFMPRLRGFAWRTPPPPPGLSDHGSVLRRALDAAVDAGHVGPVCEIAGRLGFTETLIATRLMLRAARAGHLSVVQHLHRGVAHYAAEACKRQGGSPTRAALHAACGRPEWGDKVGHVAWDHGRTDILDWLIQADCPYALCPSSHLLDDAIRRGRVSLARWVASRANNSHQISCTRAAVDMAASAGHAAAVRWAHESNLRRCAVSTLEAAAVSDRPGCLNILKWAAGEVCLPGAVAEWRDARIALKAAEYGRLEVVQWLAEAHRECLTPEAARCAARHGHSDIVLFLHEMGVAPLTLYNPLKRAAKSVNARALAAVADAGAPYDARALAVAIRHKSMPMVVVLCERYTALIDTVEAMRMAGANAACKIARHMVAVLPGACLTHARATVPPHRSAKALGQCACAACRAAVSAAKETRQLRRSAPPPPSPPPLAQRPAADGDRAVI